MRNSFAKQITELAQKDPRVVLMAGDIGNRLFDNLKAKCPDRFFNCGVAEANMIGMAAGMAMSGLRPFCYTITPFLTYRCLEQIRVDVCYHDVPVVLVGTGSGLSYASLGATHHSCEEMGMLRLLPGLAVIAPADAMEVRGALKAALNYPHPVYIRIGKKGEPVVHKTEPEFIIGKALPIRDGTDVCFLSAGTMLPAVLQAAEILGPTASPPRWSVSRASSRWTRRCWPRSSRNSNGWPPWKSTACWADWAAAWRNGWPARAPRAGCSVSASATNLYTTPAGRKKPARTMD